MAEDDKIRYSDIIQPDDSIEKLVRQLSELNKSYETMVSAIKSGADSIVSAMKTASGATSDGRKSIDEATSAASRLERAQRELRLAMSDTGKEIAWLKAQTVDQNKATVEQQRYINQAISSYDRLKSDLKETVSLYKSLTAAERADSEMGQKLLSDIINLKNQIKALDAQMRPHIQTITEVQKAEQKLAYLQSEEGQRLLDLKARIAEVTAARRKHKAVIDPLVQAQEKLAYVRSDENRQLKLYSTQIREANQVAQLQAAIANSAEGSYNRLSAQYALNKIRLNQMSQAEREAADSGKKLEAETAAIYQQMIKLQEATGNYRLSVGHYQRTWDGLGISISQVIRELPTAAVSLNTFFLGISNNIPVLVDEINRLRAQNKLLQAEGKETVNVTKAIVKGLFSWNTALVILLTALSMFGEEILSWIGSLFKSRAAVISTTKALTNIAEELESTNASYGDSIVALRQLTSEWKNLKTVAEKNQWIRDSKSEFDKLNISVNGISDAENIFVKNTEAVINALQLRAKAAAAQKLASEQYEKALIAQNNAELERRKKQERLQNVRATGTEAMTPGQLSGVSTAAATAQIKQNFDIRIKGLEDEAKAAEATADSYFKLSQQANDAADAQLKAAGIDVKHKAAKAPRGRTPRDAEDTLESLSLAATKAYQQSITDLEREEIRKRRKQYLEAYNVEVADLNKKYNKIQRILDGQDERYKKLTDEQKEQALKAQDDIAKAIENRQKEAQQSLSLLTYQQQEQDANTQLETLNLQIAAVKKGSEEELKLRLRVLAVEEQIALARNRQLPPSQQQDESTISAGFKKQRTGLITDFNNTDFEQQQALQEAQFNAVRHSETAITRFKLQQEKERWERQIQLAKAGSLEWTQAQIDAAEATVEGINRKMAELDDAIGQIGDKGVGGTLLEKLGFDDEGINAFNDAVNIVLSNLQDILAAEVQLAEEQLRLAEERREAAQSALDAEIEGRNKGYANNVATARKELEQERKREEQKRKILAQAQKRQQALDTVMQTSSLITASALLWKSMAGVPIVGPALALAAIAAMWTSFAVSKVKARQVANASEEYGEGGIEFLEGGSHASGNDIDLGANNSKGKRMRAEGGEALAIINKKRTRQYKKVLPDIIDSLNKGIFEEKYMNAFAKPSEAAIVVNANSSVDLSRLEDDVHGIRKQNETRYYTMPDGTIIIQHKNVKRIIRN